MINLEVNSVQDYIEDNNKRLKLLNSPFDPTTGEGSLIPRFELFLTDNSLILLPECMKDLEIVSLILSFGTIEKLSIGTNVDKDEIIENLLKVRLTYDFEYWCFVCFTIQDKESKSEIPFTLNVPQRLYALDLYDLMFVQCVPIRIIIVKARQWGGSTETQAFFSWIQTEWRRNWHSIIVTDVEDQARNIRGMYTKFKKGYPASMGTITYENFEGSTKIKKVTERGNIIAIASMQRPESVRSFDYALVHESEVGLWKKTDGKKPEDLSQSLTSAVANVPLSAIIVESTAKGIGNYFHRIAIKAKNELSRYKLLFIPWFFHNKYQLEIEDIEDFISVEMFGEGKRQEYNRELWQLGATLEGINWYWTYKIGEDYDDFSMMSEYPSTMEEAFQSTGSRAIPASYVIKARERNAPPVWVGEVKGASLVGKESIVDVKFLEDRTGLLKIWEKPDFKVKVSDRYIVIVDIGGRSKDADKSVIDVFDRYEQFRQVACWSGNIDLDYVAYKAAAIATFWGGARLLIESNTATLRAAMNTSEGNHAVSVIDRLAEFYYNLYFRSVLDKVTNQTVTKWGFHMNRETKPAVVDALLASLRDELIWVRDSTACDEMDTFEINDKGEYAAVPGNHDDKVDTKAIACWWHNKLPPCKLAGPSELRFTKGSIAKF